MAGALVVYGNYRGAIDAFEGGRGIRTVGGNTSSAGVFCTYPAPFMTRTSMFWSEFISSSILMFCIYACIDAGAGELLPLCLFFLVFGIGAAWGWETGYAINLARDFGPRLVSYMVGYGSEVWSAGNYYFWVSIVLALQVPCLIACGGSSEDADSFFRFQWLRHSWGAFLAGSCTTLFCTRAPRPSTRRGWA